MKTLGKLAGLMLLAAVMAGCPDMKPEALTDNTPPPKGAGETPVATVKMYYYCKDRGLFIEMRKWVREGSLSEVPSQNGKGAPISQRKFRDLIVDHQSVRESVAKVYFRTWVDEQEKTKGGRPRIAVFVKEGGVWKIDMLASVKETMIITKGQTRGGFYDGSKNWWR